MNTCLWYVFYALNLFLSTFIWLAPTLIPLILVSGAIQYFMAKRANEGVFIEALLKQMEELKADGLEYWNIEPRDEPARLRCSILEQKIKGTFRSVNSDALHYIEKYKVDDGYGDMIVGALSELFEVCTSGDFEVMNRKADRNRHIKIVNAINKVRQLMLRRKL